LQNSPVSLTVILLVGFQVFSPLKSAFDFFFSLFSPHRAHVPQPLYTGNQIIGPHQALNFDLRAARFDSMPTK